MRLYIQKNRVLTIGLFCLTILFSCSDENKEKESSSTGIDLSTFSEEELAERAYDLEKKLIDSASLQTNKQHAIDLLETAKYYAEQYPKTKKTEPILYKGVLAARGLSKTPEAVKLLSKLLIEFPESNRKVDYMFEKALALENMPNGKEEAKKLYTEIAEKYPTHFYGIQSKESLRTVEMTDEELIEFLNSQNQNAE